MQWNIEWRTERMSLSICCVIGDGNVLNGLCIIAAFPYVVLLFAFGWVGCSEVEGGRCVSLYCVVFRCVVLYCIVIVLYVRCVLLLLYLSFVVLCCFVLRCTRVEGCCLVMCCFVLTCVSKFAAILSCVLSGRFLIGLLF